MSFAVKRLVCSIVKRTILAVIKPLKSIIGFCSLLYILATVNGSTALAQNVVKPQVLKIAYLPNNQPFTSTLPSGKPIGLYIDIWRLWSATTGIPVTFETANTFAENASNLKSGKVDFLSGLFINDERAEWADFSLPIHRVDTGLFFHSDVSKPQRIGELAGNRIAVVAGFFQEGYLKANHPELDIIAVDTIADSVGPLLNKEIDIIFHEIPAMNALLGKEGLKGAFTLSDEILLSNTVHAVIAKGRPELVKIINDGLLAIPISKLIEIEKRWLPGEVPFFRQEQLVNVPSLSTKQVAWLQQHQHFSLGISPKLAPFETLNEESGYAGISADYIGILKQKLALQMTPVSGLSWTQVVDQVKAGKIDILPTVVKTSERSQFMAFTKPYIILPLVIATHKNSEFVKDLDDLEGKLVGIERSTPAKGLLQKNHSGIQLVEVDNAKQGMLLLQQRKIDAYVHNLGVIQYLLNTYDFEDIRVAAYTPYKLEIAMGVRKGLEPLVPILDSALETITAKQRAAIANNWLTVQVNVGTTLSTFLLYATPILFGLMLVIWIFIRANKRLQSEVKHRTRVERSLETALERAENASKAKDEFLANMSHEIRTPMNAVLGMSYLLGKSGLTEAQMELNGTLSSSASSLLTVINDILDLSKIEAGKIELESIPFSLQDVVKNVAAQIQFVLKKELVGLSIDIDPEIPNNLIGDPTRVGQILLNLVNNAAKFTHKGSIQISVELLSKDPELVEIAIKVVDTGIGMTPQQQTSLFETYNQADSSTTRKYGGTGLGLSICKKLSELMGGKISVQSEKDSGSEFCFMLPLRYQPEGENVKSSSADNPLSKVELLVLKGTHVLVVDDNFINLTIAEAILNNAGISVVTAEDGQLAIEAVRQHNFDAILMDIQMPVMDGYEATKYIRTELALSNIPIIALSANVMPSDVEKSLRAGMNAHVGKPLDIDDLLKTLVEHIQIYIQKGKTAAPPISA
jgi:signal transduction histidine kinase/ActR/RegA family two-component response regulator